MRTLGASVVGPAHIAEKRPNEDAWRARSSAQYTWAAVCDGLGSRPEARAGARAATRAAGRAWTLWSRARSAEPADFVRLVEVLWRLELGGIRPEDASTTVLFAGIRNDGTGLCAQLGDGLIGLRIEGTWRSVAPERPSFGSVTNALGAPHTLKDWSTFPVTTFPLGSALLLASDGVADDLVAGREAELVDWLLSDLVSDPSAPTRLRKALRGWPVPHHRDDKTLVLLWNPTEP